MESQQVRCRVTGLLVLSLLIAFAQIVSADGTNHPSSAHAQRMPASPADSRATSARSRNEIVDGQVGTWRLLERFIGEGVSYVLQQSTGEKRWLDIDEDDESPYDLLERNLGRLGPAAQELADSNLASVVKYDRLATESLVSFAASKDAPSVMYQAFCNLGFLKKPESDSTAVPRVDLKSTLLACMQSQVAGGCVVRNGLMWTVFSSQLEMTYPQAQAWCKTLRLGGFDDWRLPTLEELRVLRAEAPYWEMGGELDQIRIVRPFLLDAGGGAIWSQTLGDSTDFRGQSMICDFTSDADVAAEQGKMSARVLAVRTMSASEKGCPAALGEVVIASDVSALVTLDDQVDGTHLSPGREVRLPVPVGRHLIRVTLPGVKDAALEREVALDRPGQVLDFQEFLGESGMREVAVSEGMADRARQEKLQQYTRKAQQAQTKAGVVTRGDLMWTVRDNGFFLTWAEAEAWCRACRVGGYDDWRLPTIDELRGLYDPRRTRVVRFQERGLGDIGYSEEPLRIAAPFALDGPWIWSSKLEGPYHAYAACYDDGVWARQGRSSEKANGPYFERWDVKSPLNGRALCVRNVRPSTKARN